MIIKRYEPLVLMVCLSLGAIYLVDLVEVMGTTRPRPPWAGGAVTTHPEANPGREMQSRLTLSQHGVRGATTEPLEGEGDNKVSIARESITARGKTSGPGM
jgi:hypothetical protein